MSRSGFLCAETGQGLPPFPAPLFPLAASFLRYAPDKFLLTKPNTSCTIEMPASLRSDGVRVHPGMPFGFPPEYAFSFAGIPTFHPRKGLHGTIYTQGAFPPLNLEPVHRVPPLAGYIREREASKCNSVYDLLRVGWALIRYVTDMFSRRLTAQQIRAIGQGYHERNQTAAARRQALAAGG